MEVVTTFGAEEHEEVSIPYSMLMRDGKLDLFDDVRSGYFRLTFKKTALVLQATGHIGIIPVNPRVSIDVRPRVPIGNLQRILELSGQIPTKITGHFRTYDSEIGAPDTWIGFLADRFTSILHFVRRDGLFKRYEQKTETTLNLRGRVLLQPTLKNKMRSDPKAVVSQFERTANIIENQIIRRGLRSLHSQLLKSHAATDKKRAAALADFDRLFSRADDKYVDTSIVRSLIDRLPANRAYYGDALRIAELIQRQRVLSILGTKSAGLSAESLVLDVSYAFEGYVRRFLRDSLAPDFVVADGNVAPPKGAKRPFLVDKSGKGQESEPATPDILVFPPNPDFTKDSPLFIADCKYKKYKGAPDRESINQVLGYALSYKANKAAIIFSAKNRDQIGVRYLGHADDVVLFQIGVDLDGADLRPAETILAQKLRQILVEKDDSKLVQIQ